MLRECKDSECLPISQTFIPSLVACKVLNYISVVTPP